MGTARERPVVWANRAVENASRSTRAADPRIARSPDASSIRQDRLGKPTRRGVLIRRTALMPPAAANGDALVCSLEKSDLLLWSSRHWSRRKPQARALCSWPALANRHGLIAALPASARPSRSELPRLSARLALQYSVRREGRPCWSPSRTETTPKVAERANLLRLDLKDVAAPWCSGDVFGEAGNPVARHGLKHGPIVLARMLGLNDTQEGVLNLVFQDSRRLGILMLDTIGMCVRCCSSLAKMRDSSRRHRQRVGGLHWRHPARTARARKPGATTFLARPMLGRRRHLMQTGDGGRASVTSSRDSLLKLAQVVCNVLLWCSPTVRTSAPK